MALPLSQECSDGIEDSWSTAMSGSPTDSSMSDDYVVIDQSQMRQVLQMSTSSEINDEEVVPGCTVRQESFEGAHSSQELVQCKLAPPDPCRALQPLGLQYYWQRVSCTRDELVNVYCCSRKRLGNNVAGAHADWHVSMARASVHPVLKACALAFSVVSTPDTAMYLMKQWQEVQHQMDFDTPNYNIARFMVQYALAWALQSQDLERAFMKVKACYNDMKKLNPQNFFLAPFYTVTIGRWIYEINEKRHTLSEDVIMQVVEYADDTLHLIGTLESHWARIDTFGVKLSAMKLLMLVEGYCKNIVRLTAFCEDLRCRINHLYAEISHEFSQNHSQIVMYEAAWFHSVGATYYLNASIAATAPAEKERLHTLGQRSVAHAARLYDKNGRWWRAREEANRSDNPEIQRRYSNQEQSAPSV